MLLLLLLLFNVDKKILLVVRRLVAQENTNFRVWNLGKVAWLRDTDLWFLTFNGSDLISVVFQQNLLSVHAVKGVGGVFAGVLENGECTTRMQVNEPAHIVNFSEPCINTSSRVGELKVCLPALSMIIQISFSEAWRLTSWRVNVLSGGVMVKKD